MGVNMSKDHKITIKFTTTEKEVLAQQAETQCMGLSQFLRYKLLDQKQAPDLLEKSLPVMLRVIIDLNFKIQKLVEKELTDEELNEIYDSCMKEFTKFGISKLVKSKA